MLVSFFKSQASDKGERLLRRPPVGMRLVDGDGYIFIVRPGWKEPHLKWAWSDADKVLEIIERTYKSRLHGQSTKPLAVIEYGSLDYSRLHVESIHEVTGQCFTASLMDTSFKLLSSRSTYFDALETFTNTMKDFTLFPWMVFKRSKDKCCSCFRRLTDKRSQDRGIGPECLKRVTLMFGQPPS